MWFLIKNSLKGKRIGKLVLAISLIVIQVILDILIPLFMISLNNGLVAYSWKDVSPEKRPMQVISDLFFGNLDIDYIGNHILQYSLVIGGIIAAICIVELVIGIFAAREATKVAVDLAGDIRLNLFRKIQSLSFIDLDKLKTSSLITRLTVDVQAVQDSLISLFHIGTKAVFFYIGGIIASIITIKLTENTSNNSWIVPVILVVASISLFGILASILYYSSIFYKQSRYATDDANSVMRENILGVRVVKTFNLQEQEIERFAKVNEKMRKITEKAYKIAMWMFPIINFAMNGVMIIVIWTGAATQTLQIATAGAIMSITGLILMGMVLLINVVLQLGIAFGSSKRIQEVFKTEPSIKFNKDGVNIDSPLIQFNDVNFRYHETSEYVLRDINLTINPNETIGIIGGTGSGKTTLVSLIARMYDVHEGEIKISDHDIKTINETSLRDSIALSTQNVVLFSGTIASNLKYGKRDATLEEMVEASKGAEAYDFIMQKEAGFDSVVEQRGRNFSGGQKQRLSIARALIKKPKILILDSSTSALDMITEKKVNEYIKSTNQNRTTIIISQRISSVKDADRIIVLENGKIVGNDKHINLLKHCDEYKSIAISQLGKEGVENEIQNYK